MPTKIEWCDETINPVVGCSKVSPACDHCYAERMARRLVAMGRYDAKVVDERGWTGKMQFFPKQLEKPLHWKNPRRIFVGSMCDLFHENVPWEWQRKTFAMMHNTPWHTYLILTKRVEAMREFIIRYSEWIGFNAWPREYQHVHLGVTVENQAMADERIPILLDTPAAVRFVSYEPALGPVDFTRIEEKDGTMLDVLGGYGRSIGGASGPFTGINGVIAGGETGPGARPSHPDWFRSVRDQCVAAGVPFFFKGWGDWWPAGKRIVENAPMILHGNEAMYHVGKKRAGRLLDGREWNEIQEARS